MDEAALNTLSKKVLDAAFAVPTALGPGLLEGAYKACLLEELRTRGMFVEVEVPVPVVYNGKKLADVGYSIDLFVERELVLESKPLRRSPRSIEPSFCPTCDYLVDALGCC